MMRRIVDIDDKGVDRRQAEKEEDKDEVSGLLISSVLETTEMFLLFLFLYRTVFKTR